MITCLRQIVASRIRGTGWFDVPSDVDLGLLALTLELGADIGGVLLTDDTALQDAVEMVQRNRYVVLSSRIDTLNIICSSSLSYLNEVYTCCNLLPPRFFAVYDVLYDFVKSSNSSLSNHVRETYDRMFNQILRSISEIPHA